MADVAQPTQPGQQPMSVQDAAAKLKQANPALAQFDDHQLIGAVLKRRPELAARISSGPSAPRTPGGLQGGPGMQPISFGQGVAQGFNPFHTPPAEIQHKLPDTKMGNAATFGQDMFNAREISQRGGSGNQAGAAGMALGTGMQWGMQGKMMEGLGKGVSALGKPIGESASKTFEGFVKSVKRGITPGTGVSGTAINKATNYMKPIFTTLNKNLDLMHSALDKMTDFTPNEFQQIVRKFSTKGESAIRSLSKDLSEKSGNPRSALTFKEAENWKQDVSKLLSKEQLKGFHGDLEQLHEILDKMAQDIANNNGYGQVRKRLLDQWKQMHDVTREIARTTEEKASTAKKVIGTGIGAGVGAMGTMLTKGSTEGMVVGGLVGERAAASTKYVLKEDARAAAEKLAGELGISPNMMNKITSKVFYGGDRMAPKIGRGIQKYGKSAVPTVRAASVATAPKGQQQQ